MSSTARAHLDAPEANGAQRRAPLRLGRLVPTEAGAHGDGSRQRDGCEDPRHLRFLYSCRYQGTQNGSDAIAHAAQGVPGRADTRRIQLGSEDPLTHACCGDEHARSHGEAYRDVLLFRVAYGEHQHKERNASRGVAEAHAEDPSQGGSQHGRSVVEIQLVVIVRGTREEILEKQLAAVVSESKRKPRVVDRDRPRLVLAGEEGPDVILRGALVLFSGRDGDDTRRRCAGVRLGLGSFLLFGGGLVVRRGRGDAQDLGYDRGNLALFDAVQPRERLDLRLGVVEALVRDVPLGRLRQDEAAEEGDHEGHAGHHSEVSPALVNRPVGQDEPRGARHEDAAQRPVQHVHRQHPASHVVGQQLHEEVEGDHDSAHAEAHEEAQNHESREVGRQARQQPKGQHHAVADHEGLLAAYAVAQDAKAQASQELAHEHHGGQGGLLQRR
eukprot:scaffold1376_cov257-Pinguiococcus_pyrenoidosus.AAC.20